MTRVPGVVNLLPLLPVLFAHLAGVVVAIILLVRSEGRRTPATLSLLGFALLFILDLANVVQGPLIGLLSRRTATGIRLVTVGVGCCYSVFDATAILCLIIAIWQALAYPRVRKTEPRPTSTTREEG